MALKFSNLENCRALKTSNLANKFWVRKRENLENFKALKLSELESFRPLNTTNLLNGLWGPKSFQSGECNYMIPGCKNHNKYGAVWELYYYH